MIKRSLSLAKYVWISVCRFDWLPPSVDPYGFGDPPLDHALVRFQLYTLITQGVKDFCFLKPQVVVNVTHIRWSLQLTYNFMSFLHKTVWFKATPSPQLCPKTSHSLVLFGNFRHSLSWSLVAAHVPLTSPPAPAARAGPRGIAAALGRGDAHELSCHFSGIIRGLGEIPIFPALPGQHQSTWWIRTGFHFNSSNQSTWWQPMLDWFDGDVKTYLICPSFFLCWTLF